MSTSPHETLPPSAQTSGPASLLDRPRADRAREFRYRFAQAAVFGAPVVALQFLGPTLGGASAFIWVGLLQAVLSGWILYIGGTGLLIEGAALLLIRRQLTIDMLVAVVCVVFYAIGLFSYVRSIPGAPPRANFFFLLSTSLLVLWCGVRWFALARRSG